MQLKGARRSPAGTAVGTVSEVGPALLVLFAGAVLLRLINLDSLPRNDELYTLLAARGWLEHGMPRIGDGVYERAELYTVLVAGFFRLFGESFAVARLPAVFAGSLLVVAVFLWTRATCGPRVAWVAALFMALAPLSIQEGQFARFYALHGLAFWLGAIAVYALVEDRPGWRAGLALALGAGLCLALARHLQPTTLIGLVGLGLWLVLVVGLPRLFTGRWRRWRWHGVAAAAVLFLLLAALMVQSGLAGELWERYRWTPLHAAARRNEVWHYHLQLIERYPSLWPVFPFTALLAIRAAPRPALFCTTVFAVVFGLLSFGGMKHLNYLFVVYPFLFVIWALALVQVWTVLRRVARGAVSGALRRGAPVVAGRGAERTVMAVALAFLVLGNGAPARTLLKPFGISIGQDETSIDWGPASAVLAPWLERAEVVLTPNDMHTMYYLGDYDLALNASRLSEIRGGEFAVDPRTGRPVIGTAGTLADIIGCYPAGLVVIGDELYDVERGVTEEMIVVLERAAERVEAPRGLHAFFWEQPARARRAAACRRLPEGRRPGPAGD